MNDLVPPVLATAINKLLEQGSLVVLLLLALYFLWKRSEDGWKKYGDVQEKRVSESLEREKSVTIALTQVGDAIKSIVISQEKKS